MTRHATGLLQVMATFYEMLERLVLSYLKVWVIKVTENHNVKQEESQYGSNNSPVV